MKLKLILQFLTILTIVGCSSDSNEIEETIIPEPVSVLTLTNSSTISNTPFTNPLETIVFNNSLYAINDANTYKYDFSLNTWEVVNTNSSGVGYLNYSVSFIRNSKWHIINQNALWAFDFSSNVWEKLKQFSNNNLLATIGVYDNDSLYIFSDIFNKIYRYNFDDNSLIDHSTFDQTANFGQLVKSIFKIGDAYYYTKLSDYSKISIYKWTNNFTAFEFLNEYRSEFIAQGSGFVFEDNIIFGLGGELRGDGNGNITSYILNNEFYYYNTSKNEFKKVENNFYEGRIVPLPVKHNGDLYLLGGRTVINNESIFNQTLDKLNFEFIDQ